jgi:arsenate reductase
MLKAYIYSKCDTCRKAVKFLRENGIAFEEIPIRETPPSIDELRAMLTSQGGQLRKLFNTSGADYKALGLSTVLPNMTSDDALQLLASNGNLVKRPFAVGDGVHLVGFDESKWCEALHR